MEILAKLLNKKEADISGINLNVTENLLVMAQGFMQLKNLNSGLRFDSKDDFYRRVHESSIPQQDALKMIKSVSHEKGDLVLWDERAETTDDERYLSVGDNLISMTKVAMEHYSGGYNLKDEPSTARSRYKS